MGKARVHVTNAGEFYIVGDRESLVRFYIAEVL